MMFEPSCCEFNDCLKCAWLRDEMGCARHYFDTLFSSETFQGRLSSITPESAPPTINSVGDGGQSLGAGIFQRSDEKQQSAELVVGALVRTSMKAMDHVDIGAANGIEWSRLVLAIFKIPLFMGAEGMRQQLADIASEIVGSVQGE